MKSKNKEDVLRVLNEDENFKSILSMTKDETERKAIKAYTESFVMTVYQSLLNPLENALQQDPDAVNKALRELQEDLIKGDGAKKEDG